MQLGIKKEKYNGFQISFLIILFILIILKI